MILHTDKIYSLMRKKLIVRPGDIAFDEASHARVEEDDQGPLHVVSGLQDPDVAVFFRTESHHDVYSKFPSHIGYLVTDVETDGSGILVGRQLFETHPSEWVNARVENKWQQLHYSGYDIGAEFGMIALQRYFDAKNVTDI